MGRAGLCLLHSLPLHLQAATRRLGHPERVDVPHSKVVCCSRSRSRSQNREDHRVRSYNRGPRRRDPGRVLQGRRRERMLRPR